jgi:hypothetical protein
MKQFALFLFSMAISFAGFAAGADTVRYAAAGQCWSIVHRMAPGERLALAGQRYRVPAGTLERSYPAIANTAGNGELIDIPVGVYNRIVDMPWSLDTARPLYYQVQTGEKLADISRCARMSRNDLMLINGLSAEPVAGTFLCVGWVRYDRRLLANSPMPVGSPASGRPTVTISVAMAPQRPPVSTTRAPVRPAATTPQLSTPMPPVPDPQQPVVDTMVVVPRPPVQTMGDIWNYQTQNGQTVTAEKGSVAFYTLNSKAPGAAAYAFHNSAARGSIIRVRNMNNGKSIYVKVLGPLPDTKQYSGAILGLTMVAKRALGVREERAFCELSYAGY